MEHFHLCATENTDFIPCVATYVAVLVNAVLVHGPRLVPRIWPNTIIPKGCVHCHCFWRHINCFADAFAGTYINYGCSNLKRFQKLQKAAEESLTSKHSKCHVCIVSHTFQVHVTRSRLFAATIACKAVAGWKVWCNIVGPLVVALC